MNNNIIARKQECEALQNCMAVNTSQLVIVYGRRRVGKTYLINQFFDDNFAFKVTGIYNEPKEVQLQSFAKALKLYFNFNQETPKSWFDAFELLRVSLTSYTKRRKKVVIFFDEFPWLDTQKSDFLAAFEWFWNDWGCAKNNLVCIICGSATSWMVDHIDHNKGGLFNRQNCRIFLEPFNLDDTNQFLLSKNIEWSLYDITSCYMIMITFFSLCILSLVFFRLSEKYNRFRWAFCGIIVLTIVAGFRDYSVGTDTRVYHTLFSNSEVYIRIVELLASKRIGFSRLEISEKAKLPANGMLSTILDNLVYSGFVRAYPYYGNKKKLTLYQLCDYYSLFYFRFLKDNYGRDENFWSNSSESPAVKAWQGFTFEQLCKDHINQIKQKIGISGVLSDESSWFVQADDENDGAQIDMLIDRRDKVINICEIKFSSDEFLIDKDYEQNLRKKINRFLEVTKSKKTIQLTMITSFGVKKNMYSNRVTNQVLLEDLFLPKK